MSRALESRPIKANNGLSTLRIRYSMSLRIVCTSRKVEKLSWVLSVEEMRFCCRF